MSKYGYENTFPGSMNAGQVRRAVWQEVYDTMETPYIQRETGIPAKESADEAANMYFADKVFKTADEGREYCCAHRNQFTRPGFAFKAATSERTDPTKTMVALKERIGREEAKLSEYETAHNAKNRKSAYIGCKKCGSSVNKEYIGASNKCPVCGESLFSATDTETIARYRENIKRWRADLKKMEESGGKKKIVWFVSTSYH